MNRAAMLLLMWALSPWGCLAAPLEVVTEDSSYSYMRDGKVAGSATEQVEASLKAAGIADYHITLYPWARAYAIAQREGAVLIYPIVRTPAREKLFKWGGQLDRIEQHLYRLSERTQVRMQTLEEGHQYTIGVVRDDSRQEYLQSRGFSRMVVSANNPDNFRRLLNHQVDLIPMPEREARHMCDEMHIAFEDLERVYTLDELADGLYFAFSLATPDAMVETTRTAFGRLNKAVIKQP